MIEQHCGAVEEGGNGAGVGEVHVIRKDAEGECAGMILEKWQGGTRLGVIQLNRMSARRVAHMLWEGSKDEGRTA